MATVTGTVGWAGKNKFGKFSLKLDENPNWYNSQYEIKASKGDTVEFDDGGKNYVNKLRVVGGSTGGGSGTAQASNTSGMTKDRTIIRQNSLGHATELVTSFLSVDVAGGHSEVEQAADFVIEIARKFESYSTGDLDEVKTPAGANPDEDKEFL